MTHMFETIVIEPGQIANVSRRLVLKGIVASGALVLGTSLLSRSAMSAWDTGAGKMPGGTVNDPHVYIAVDASGLVTIVTNRSEMGTGVRTSLPMVVADEMEADWARVHVAQAPGDEKTYGNQDTDGSRSVRHFIQPMRQCGAAMRMMLEQAAAARWGVDVAQVRAENHKVVHLASGNMLGYGELAKAASALPTPSVDNLKLKDPSAFRYIGTGSIPIVDLHDITTGQATYGIDAKLPGMKFAVIERPPVVGGKLVSFDPSEALKVPGVEKVMEVQGWPWPSKFMPVGGVAVVARNTGSAIKGREKLKVVWDNGPNATYDSAVFRKQMEETAAAPCKVVRNDGDADDALKSAAKVVSAQYYIPHLAHASMEPPTATVHVRQGKAGTECVAFAPTQSPGGCRDDLAKLLGIPVENVTVNVTLLGGGFGRKSKWDYVLEAALVSKAVDAPVKVTWTREDDVRHDFYHTVSVERIDAGIDADGKVVAWRHRSVAPRSCPHSRPARITRRRSNWAWGWWTIPSTSRTCAARTVSARLTRASAGSAPSPTSRAPLRYSRWLRRSRRRWGAIRRTCCWNCSDRTASSIRESQRTWPTSGTTATRSRLIRSTLDACAVSRSLRRSRPNGARRCHRVRDVASPRTGAF
jgi:isoquinoline 1-oxidoreductase subunit beta